MNMTFWKCSCLVLKRTTALNQLFYGFLMTFFSNGFWGLCFNCAFRFTSCFRRSGPWHSLQAGAKGGQCWLSSAVVQVLPLWSEFTAASHVLHWGAPQGTILCLRLFSLYLLVLFFRKHVMPFHCQIYFPLKHYGSVQPLLDCLNKVKLALNFLSFITKNTEIMLLKSSGCSCTFPLWHHMKNPVSSVKLNPCLKFDSQVTTVVKSCFFQLRRLHPRY